MMWPAVSEFMVKWKRGKFEDTERSGLVRKRVARPPTLQLPQVFIENSLSLIPSVLRCSSQITTYTALIQIPLGLPTSPTLVIEESGQPRIVIDIEDTEDRELVSSECPLSDLNLLSTSEELGLSRILTNPMYSPAHSSSEDDHPLSSFLSPGHRHKIIASPPALSPSPRSRAPTNVPVPPLVASAPTILVTSSLPSSILSLKATPDVLLQDLPESSTRLVPTELSFSINPSNPLEGLWQALNL